MLENLSMTSYTLSLVIYSVMLSVAIKNPFSFSLFLVYLSIVGGLSLGVWVSSWSFYVIILIFVGGMMVMLLYVSTFSSDPKISMKFNWILGLIVSASLIPICFSESESYTSGKIEILEVYSSGGVSTFLSAGYLLITLLFIVKLSESFKGSLSLTSL